MLTAATGLVIEDDDGRPAFQVIAAIGPHIGPFRLALAGIELLDRKPPAKSGQARI